MCDTLVEDIITFAAAGERSWLALYYRPIFEREMRLLAERGWLADVPLSERGFGERDGDG